MLVNDKGGARWTSGIDRQYPSISPRFHANEGLKDARQIILGVDGYYFIRGRTKNSWNLPRTIRDHIDIETNGPQIVICALGSSESYFFQLSDGRTFWNLTNRHERLKRKLETEVASKKLVVAVSDDALSVEKHD